MELTNDCFNNLTACPWCEADVNNSEYLYTDAYSSEVIKCKACGLVYAKRRLNNKGLAIYWDKYSSRVHTSDKTMTAKRDKMYLLDFNYIDDFISQEKLAKKVLDVGCGEGGFLDIFKANGYATYGVEYGHEAAKIAGTCHKVIDGSLPELVINEKFDLVVFRGVLQYLPDVKDYINKAYSLIKDGGLLFITAQPNMSAICAKLFKENFVLNVSSTDFIGFNEKILTNYMNKLGAVKLGEKYFYEETPYADVKEDILKMARAINLAREGRKIDFKAPAFYGNMLSLVYKK